MVFLLLQWANAQADKDKEFLRWHNIARCVVGVPPLKWNKTLADYSATVCAKISPGRLSRSDHSESYKNVNAGENLGQGYRSVEQAVYDGWSVSEYFSGGHYTAMNWRGGDTLGCNYAPRSRSYCCNYGSTTGNIPNGGRRGDNVPTKIVKSKDECIKEVDAGGSGNTGGNTGSGNTGSGTDAPTTTPAPASVPNVVTSSGAPDTTTPAEEGKGGSAVVYICVAVAAIVAFIVFSVMVRKLSSESEKPPAGPPGRVPVHNSGRERKGWEAPAANGNSRSTGGSRTTVGGSRTTVGGSRSDAGGFRPRSWAAGR